MLIQFPVVFEITSECFSGSKEWISGRALDKDKKTVSKSEKFHGIGEGTSPEEYYAIALGNQFILEFTDVAKKNKCNYEKIETRSVLQIGPSGVDSTELENVELIVVVSGFENREKMEVTLKQSITRCWMWQMIKSKKTFRYQLIHDLKS